MFQENSSSLDRELDLLILAFLTTVLTIKQLEPTKICKLECFVCFGPLYIWGNLKITFHQEDSIIWY